MIFSYFQINEVVEDTCVLSNCAFIVIIYENLNVKVALNILLIGLVSNLLVIYFYDSKVFQILYLNYHKLNGGPNIYNPFSYVYVKSCILNFGQTNFFIYFIMFLPLKQINWLLQIERSIEQFNAIEHGECPCKSIRSNRMCIQQIEQSKSNNMFIVPSNDTNTTHFGFCDWPLWLCIN